MNKIQRYSPGAYGAMCEDEGGDYVRLSEIEPLVQKAVDHAKDSGIFAGSILADENAEELRKARELLRWRKVGEEMPKERGYYLTLEFGKNAFLDYWPGEWKRITHWRPVGPLPEGGK